MNKLKNNSNFIQELPLINTKLIKEITKPVLKLLITFNYNNLFLLLNILLKNKS